MAKTLIPWADFTINPVVGCSKCSPGCERCYAEKFAARLAGNPNEGVADRYRHVTTNGKWNGKVSFSLHPFDSLPKNKPCRVFLGSETDMFYAPEKYLRMCLDEMVPRKHCTFMLLTKRPEKAKEYFGFLGHEPLPNVWLGVTVCNQDEAGRKIPILLDTPAAKRFVSIEPMLGPITIARWLRCKMPRKGCIDPEAYTNSHDTEKLDWVILGGETGPGARPMDADWARCVRDQCKEARVPFFFKKMGGKKPTPDDLMIREVPE
jgi:protein gp37